MVAETIYTKVQHTICEFDGTHTISPESLSVSVHLSKTTSTGRENLCGIHQSEERDTGTS